MLWIASSLARWIDGSSPDRCCTSIVHRHDRARQVHIESTVNTIRDLFIDKQSMRVLRKTSKSPFDRFDRSIQSCRGHSHLKNGRLFSANTKKIQGRASFHVENGRAFPEIRKKYRKGHLANLQRTSDGASACCRSIDRCPAPPSPRARSSLPCLLPG